MVEFSVHPDVKVTMVTMGSEKIPLVVIDNWLAEPESLIDLACDQSDFMNSASDFYPGVRNPMPASYGEYLCTQLLSLLKTTFAQTQAKSAHTVLSAFSISTTPPEQLRPIQTIPHFDTAAENQLAVIHYLCDERHGGTSFYRHRHTGFERITTQRLPEYAALLKQQAMTQRLHENPCYIEGDTVLFTRIHTVEARKNRVIVYPSNVLHSGNIRPEMGLSGDPRQGRLTISSFIVLR